MRKQIHKFGRYSLAVLFVAGMGASSLCASTMTWELGEETDTLSIALDPANGAIGGSAGSTVGWGFTVNFTGTNNYISFTGSSLGSLDAAETNSSFLDLYSDLIGAQGGPADFVMAPNTQWTQVFDANGGTGVGTYAISSDPLLAIPGAQDTGQLTFFFDVYQGNPFDPDTPGTYLDSLAYYGPSTAFSVTVDGASSVSDTPEPGTFVMLAGAGLALAFRRFQGAKAQTQPIRQV